VDSPADRIMSEQRFVILKYVGKTASMATCERCHVKFFIPMAFLNDPEGAEEHLRQKYAEHNCRILRYRELASRAA
jgi:hypothetical protein